MKKKDGALSPSAGFDADGANMQMLLGLDRAPESSEEEMEERDMQEVTRTIIEDDSWGQNKVSTPVKSTRKLS